jgi:hypothetical protein
MSQINGEFGRGPSLNNYRGTDYYTSAGGPFVFPASPISFNNFYGTSDINPIGYEWVNSTPLTAVPSWGLDSAPTGVAWNGSVFGVGANPNYNGTTQGRFATSPDGINWTFQPGLEIALGMARSPMFIGGRPGQFVAYAGASAGGLATSPDGVTWTSIPFPPFWGSNDNVTQWVYGNGTWVGRGSAGNAQCLVSTDGGVTWDSRGTSMGSGSVTDCGAWSGTAFLFGGGTTGARETRAAVSPNGINWTGFQAIPNLRPAMSFRRISGAASNGSIFVVVGEYNTCCTVSADGLTWTTQTGLQAIFGTAEFPSISKIIWAYNSGLFIATGTSGICAVSPDGINWTQSYGLAASGFISGTRYNNMAYNGSRIICVAYSSDSANVAYTPG